MSLAACTPSSVPKTDFPAISSPGVITPTLTATATATATMTATVTPSPTPTPTATPLPTGVLWYDEEQHIPALLGSTAMFDEEHREMQEQATQAMAKYWLESPYTQRMLDALVENGGVSCAYTKAFENAGKDTIIDASTEVPGGVVYPHSLEGAVQSYINGEFVLTVQKQPSVSEKAPTNGWLLFTETVPGKPYEAANPIFYLGYDEDYGKQYLDWQQLCSGLPFLVWDEQYGFLTRDLLRDPEIAEKISPDAALALTEALFYEMERAPSGYGQVRETYFVPFLMPTLTEVNEETKLRMDADITSPEEIDPRKLYAHLKYESIVDAEGRLREDEPAQFWLTHYFEESKVMRDEPPYGFGNQNYDANDVSQDLLWPVDNKMPFTTTILTDVYTDGMYHQMDIPMAVTSDYFWKRLLLEMGYQRPEDEAYLRGEGGVLDLMFGLDLPNFRADQAQAQPLTFRLGVSVGGFGDGFLPTWGTMLSNPLRMEEVVSRWQNALPAWTDDNGDTHYVWREVVGGWDNQSVADWGLAAAPLIPALQFHMNMRGAVVYGDWKPVSSPPELEELWVYKSHDEEAPYLAWAYEYMRPGSWFGNYSFGSTFYLGGGHSRPSVGDGHDSGPYSPYNAASGRYQYGGPVFFVLNDMEINAARQPFPFQRYGATFVNPQTGKYTLNEKAIRLLSHDNAPISGPKADRDLGAYLACAPSAKPDDVPNNWFIIAAETCIANLTYERGHSHMAMELFGGAPAQLKQSAVEQRENIQIAEGMGEIILQSVLLAGDPNLYDNPEAIKSIQQVGWLAHDQQALREAAKNGEAVYDENAPFYGIFVMPGYHVPVFYYAANPVCAFDANCLVMSSVDLNKTLGNTDTISQSAKNPFAMAAIVEPDLGYLKAPDGHFWARKFGNDIFPGALRYPAESFIYWSTVSPQAGIDKHWHDEFDAAAKEFEIHQRSVYTESGHFYTMDMDKTLALMGGVEDYDFTWESPEPWNPRAIALIDEATQYGKIDYDGAFSSRHRTSTFTIQSYEKPNENTTFGAAPWDTENHWAPDVMDPTIENLSLAWLTVIPSSPELAAVAQEAGVCLPYPHVEQGECAIEAVDGTGTQWWFVPHKEKDYDGAIEFVKELGANNDQWQIQETHAPQELKDLADYSMFTWAERMFGKEYAERLWVQAWQMAYQDMNIKVRPYDDTDNSAYISTLAPEPRMVPVLAWMFAQGEYGGIPAIWARLTPEMLMRQAWADHIGSDDERWFDPFYTLDTTAADATETPQPTETPVPEATEGAEGADTSSDG